ncbi:hypothetical protein ACQ8YR_002613 [Yersinia enterocolitica]|nr:AAA family ATPase [Yersinia enterocolitica]EKN5021412.1 hypothetical protein [Yersinia enterocolitica]EKN5065985.1 hypothetical protein [Yersinia enterocolitica]EKN5131620.1 hypothetical protein [Yersinia enterocolitica]HDL6991952.1 AAA family ATPase [Yersinia enterocolitica]
MRLLKLKIFPKGRDGWMSEELIFAEHITQIFGPNGCGKTPVVQSISYCLGYPNVFRNDIYERCSHAILHVITAKGEYQFKRYYEKDQLHINITEPNGVIQTFYDETSHSEFIFDLMDFNVNQLVTINSKATSPYLSLLLPIFYLDQDDGYGRIYSPPKNFIKDQFSEIVRMAFRLPPRNSVDEKREKKTAKDNLDSLDRVVQLLERQVEAVKIKSPEITKTPAQLRSEIQDLEIELEQLKGAGNSHDDSIGIYDRLISNHRTEIRDLEVQIAEILKRQNGIQKIIADINTEIETLSLNEGAKRIFLSFDEICGSNNCQLFSLSSNSYSKNLLYLKDQLKDLERNRVSDSVTLTHLQKTKLNYITILQTIIDERNTSVQKPELATLVDAISRIKNKVFELQTQLSEIEHILLLEDRLFTKITERNYAFEKHKGLTGTRSTSPELMKLKLELKELFINWLDSIHTTNISKDITYSDDFTPKLGAENITQLKGSTRIRTVLAYHAALIELLMQQPKANFRFIILDTPKQHDIENKDLDSYIKTLKVLAGLKNVQIIFSTTGYHYNGDQDDKEWNPKFPGDDHLMFFKKNDNLDIKSIS